MRVMHVMAGAKEGGAENIMLESVCALAGTGLTQFVVTRPDNKFRLNMFASAGIGYATCSFNLRWPFPSRKKVQESIERFRPDVIQYWMGRAGQFAPAKYRARSVAWYGGYYKRERFSNCDWHIGLTKDLLRHIREQGVADDRSLIVHTYADFEEAEPIDRASLQTPTDAPVALALARLHEKKGLDVLLDAAKRIEGLYVWIAGDGPLEGALKAQARALAIEDRVRFLGWRNDRGALLAACDLVAFPSRYEPFGTVTVDAWAAGKPLVAADAVGPAAYVENEISGLVVPKNDDEALADAMRRVITDKALGVSLIDGGLRAYEEQFTKAVYVHDQIAAFERVVAAAG